MTDTKKDTAPSVATVDTPEFRQMLADHAEANVTQYELIAHIDAHIDAHVAAQVAAKDAEIKTLTAALDAQGELTDRYQEIALSAQAAAPVVADLHAQIMNIPPMVERSIFASWTRSEQNAYNLGHRDACHAAAELVASQPSPAPVAMTDEQIEKIVRDVTGDYKSEYLESDRNFYGDFTRAILAAQQEAV